MDNFVDIDAVSIFVQDEVAHINAAIIAHNWSANTSTEWSNEGYEILMRYCLRDDGHVPSMRQAAVRHVRQEMCAKMDVFDTFIGPMLKGDELKKAIGDLGQHLLLKNFIARCQDREKRIQNINELISAHPTTPLSASKTSVPRSR